MKSVRLFESGPRVFLRLLNIRPNITQGAVARISGVGNLHARCVRFTSSFVHIFLVSALVKPFLERSFSGCRPGLLELFDGRESNRSGTPRLDGFLHLDGSADARLVLVWWRL